MSSCMTAWHKQSSKSTRPNGTQNNTGASISADGRYVGFSSSANNLVPGDTNGIDDAFVYDRQGGTIVRISVASDGTQGNGYSSGCQISADGNFASFSSSANNLVPGDTNGTLDIFVYDRQTDTIERISVASDGTQANSQSTGGSMSANGRFVGFASSASNLVPGDTNGTNDAFVYDRQTDTIQRVSLASDGTQANSQSMAPSISSDGRFVGFSSWASNLVPNDTNGVSDIFVYDRADANDPASEHGCERCASKQPVERRLVKRRRPLRGV